MAYWRGSEVPLEKEKEWVSQVGMRERHDTVDGVIFTDKNGILFIDQSGDGKNWDVSTSYEIEANNGKGFTEPLVASYWRVRFANNSGSNQGVFRISANTQAGGDS